MAPGRDQVAVQMSGVQQPEMGSVPLRAALLGSEALHGRLRSDVHADGQHPASWERAGGHRRGPSTFGHCPLMRAGQQRAAVCIHSAAGLPAQVAFLLATTGMCMMVTLPLAWPCQLRLRRQVCRIEKRAANLLRRSMGPGVTSPCTVDCGHAAKLAKVRCAFGIVAVGGRGGTEMRSSSASPAPCVGFGQ